MQKTIRLKATTVGSAGVATVTVDSDVVVMGRITRVDVDYHASAPATTDVTLAQVNERIATPIVSLPNNATDKQVFPSVQFTDNAGVGRTYDGTRPVVVSYPVCDILRLTVAQCDALTNAVVCDVYYED